jgi:hypothetical protein
MKRNSFYAHASKVRSPALSRFELWHRGNRLKAGLQAFYLLALAMFPVAVSAQTLGYATNGSGVRGYSDTPIQPWSGFRVHDADRPAPNRVDPGPVTTPAPAPADAVVLFDGRSLSEFASNNWRIVDGCIEASAGNLTTKQSFGDCQIHLEWMVPTNFTGHMFDHGNNGVMLMGLYEIQIFDSFSGKLYPDGQAASVYGQTPPLMNACRKPGEWQSYDIIFNAPKFADGKLVQPARVTVIHNGVLVQNHQEIYGETAHRDLPEYKSKLSFGPLAFAGHNCPVRIRNIWLRRL